MRNFNLFNSSQEISYRVLVLLRICDKTRVSMDRLASLDFISIYGVDFGISEVNLHGNNQFKFSEFTNRRKLFEQAIKQLVLLGYVKFYPQSKGFLYGITSEGYHLADEFNNSYVEQYRDNALNALKFSMQYTDRKLVHLITEYSIHAAEEG